MRILRSFQELFKAKTPSENTSSTAQEMYDFFETSIEEIMIPRSDIVALSYQLSFEEIVKAFLKAGFRWLPVYRDTLDHITGVISIHSVLSLREAQASSMRWYRHLNHASFAPAAMTVREAINELYVNHSAALFIVDEHGGIQGMVTKGHVLKEFSSLYLSEFTEEESLIVSKDPWIIRGRMGLDDFLQEFEVDDLFTPEDEEKVSTIGGWLCSFLGRVPLKGEVIEHPSGFSFEIRQADPRKIYEIGVIQIPEKKSLVALS
jgi:magnesium and cobalt transporter